ncbi:MAG: hypothetical protein OIF32_12265 [Campylobacterales bacterium]|nr:hypothetical protein [Campylobacterales bacterium]
MNSIEVAAFICEELEKLDIKTTLSGGFCVEIYSHGEYTSMDIDLIDHYYGKHKAIIAKMLELGFKQDGKNFYHDDFDYTVEFPTGPLAVGDSLVDDFSEIETEYGVLRILTVDDCVRDRLSVYYAWDDERGLEQALLVAEKYDIDMEMIEEWSKSEKEEERFDIFKTKLEKRKIKN